jgi:soluble lytic murein transglycosylase-like protein
VNGTALRILVLVALAAMARPATAADPTDAPRGKLITIRPYAPARPATAVTRPPPTGHMLDPDEIRAAVHRLAPDFGLDEALVIAVILAESDFVADAISPKNAIGLMQLMPETAARFGVSDPFNPFQNLRGGMAYLRFLSERYNGNLGLTLAAYNAGEGAVDQYRGIPPFAETRDYVARVQQYYGDPTALQGLGTKGANRPHEAGNWRGQGKSFTIEHTRVGVLIVRGSGPSAD